MPERTAFDHAAEIQQNRVQPTELSPLEGEWVFVLGSEDFRKVDVDTGDKIILSTTWDFTASPLGFFGIFIKELPSSSTDWKLTVSIETWDLIARALSVRARPWMAYKVPTPYVTGSKTIKITLEST